MCGLNMQIPRPDPLSQPLEGGAQDVQFPAVPQGNLTDTAASKPWHTGSTLWAPVKGAPEIGCG